MLTVVRETVTWNGTRAELLQLAIGNDQLLVATELETARWEAVRAEFVELLDGPDLLGRVAFFFAKVSDARRLAELHFEFSVGVASTISSSQTVRDGLRKALVELLPGIVSEAGRLDVALKEVGRQ